MGSSIGYVGTEPVLASSQRLRGFLTGLLTRTDLTEFLDRFGRYRASILEEANGVTRLSLRVIAEDDLLDLLPAVEARIPLGDGSSLLYLGVNTLERGLTSGEESALDERRRSATAHFGPGGSADAAKLVTRLERAHEKGYSVMVTDRSEGRAALAASDLPAIASLLLAFGYDKDDAAAILDDPANLIGVVRRGTEVVGFGISETADIDRGTRAPPLRVAELTDSIVDDRHTGNGLQTLIHLRLMDALLARSTPPALVFSESTYGGSLHNAATLGRTFGGLLPNHALIETGSPNPTPASRYQSLEVTSTTANAVRDLLEELRPILDATEG